MVRFIFKHRRLDQLIEGTPTALIENGQVRPEGLAKELLTEAELISVAHRQGFANLDEVENCVLEPGGVFFLQGKRPAIEERRHTEVIERLEELGRQIADLQREARAH